MAFTLYSFAIGFACPLLLIAAFYTCVIRKLRKAIGGPASASASSRRSRARETTNKRIEHLVIGIICTYTFCWLPYWIAQLCVSFNLSNHLPWFYQFFMIGTALTYTNSALNPILYAFLSDNFKRRCSDVFSSIIGLRLWCHKQNCFIQSHIHSQAQQTIQTNIIQQNTNTSIHKHRPATQSQASDINNTMNINSTNCTNNNNNNNNNNTNNNNNNYHSNNSSNGDSRNSKTAVAYEISMQQTSCNLHNQFQLDPTSTQVTTVILKEQNPMLDFQTI